MTREKLTKYEFIIEANGKRAVLGFWAFSEREAIKEGKLYAALSLGFPFMLSRVNVMKGVIK